VLRATGVTDRATVSVVVPTYRRTERLAACLDGLRSQTRAADEVLVVVHVSDEPSTGRVSRFSEDWPALRSVRVGRHGLVAALNRGLAAAGGSIVAFIDDDAVPNRDWVQRIVETFERDDRIAAVGGRDEVIENGRLLRSGRLAKAPTVGQIQWFGRMLGNHHIGSGAPRDVDVLKGVNMSFRRAAVARHGFDERLRGEGAQVHSELSICLPLRRCGLRIVYDPNIVVTHHPATRPHGDHRHGADWAAVEASAHNEALQILDHFGPPRRLVYLLWGCAIGTTEAPGLAVTVRDAVTGRPAAWSRFAASQRGRAAARQTRRVPRRVASSTQ
jgi:cellulose synthase/poly-beta-1,6-N-acetylglucosamine synthase-like glycosyltransferase